MAMPINDLKTNVAAQVFCEQGFRDSVESVLSIIKANQSNRLVQIEPGDAYKYEYDFYGLLAHLGIPPSLHWATLRVNGYRDPRDYLVNHDQIIIPTEDDLIYVRRMYKSRKGVV